MSTTLSTSGPRHRVDSRPSTPLTQIARTATAQFATVSRRSAAVVTTSTVAIGLIGAAPATAADGAVSLASVDTSTVADAAKAQLASAPVVSSPAGAAWTADSPAVSASKPVVKAAAKATAKAASRSTARATTTTATATATSTADVPASVAGNAVLEVAARYVGVPYVSGGSGPSSFDCSGFVSYVYAQLGVSLPHSSSAISGMGTRVSAADAQPGDIIWSPGHVAIYAGGDMMIDANHSGGSVQFRSMWQSNPVFIRV